MPKIDIDKVPETSGCNYPPPLDQPCLGSSWRALGDAAGLTDFGVNRVRLPHGVWASQRHWHTEEDEFVMILEGEVVLVEDEGETVLRAGDCAGWKAGVANGHHLQNRSGRDAVYLEMGSRRPATDACSYPDVDLHAPCGPDYTHKDGRPYTAE